MTGQQFIDEMPPSMIGLTLNPTKEQSMAHKIKITSKPHINADGSKSKTKKDHIVSHRHRGKKTIVGTFTNRGAAEEALEAEKLKTFGAPA